MISVAICTRQRPVLLRKMLESCTKIQADPRTDIEFIVVENGPKGQAGAIAQDFATRLAIRYAHVPETGLVHARNGAIEAFLQGNGDWMAFMDDDVMVDSNWLREMLDVMQAHVDGLAFAGRHLRLEADGSVSKTYHIGPPTGSKSGVKVWNVSTANMLFHRSVVSQEGHGIRFHPAFNLSGGEDMHFGQTLKAKGIPFLWAEKAVVREYVHPERMTTGQKIRRSITQGNNQGQSAMLRHGALLGRLENLGTGVLFLVNSLTYGLAALVMFVDRDRHIRLRAQAVKFFLAGLGRFRSLFLRSMPVYEKVAGK